MVLGLVASLVPETSWAAETVEPVVVTASKVPRTAGNVSQNGETMPTGEMTLVAIVHDPNLAFWHGDDFFFVAEGRVFTPDPQRPPWSSDLVQRVYGMPVDTLPWKDRAVVVPKVFSQ